MKEAELFKQNGVNPVWPDCIRLALSLRLKSREQAAAQQNEQARMHSPCTVLALLDLVFLFRRSKAEIQAIDSIDPSKRVVRFKQDESHLAKRDSIS